jgi:hypothetical protein
VNYIYIIYVTVSCKRYPPSLPYIIIVQACGKRWDLPKFVDVLSVNLGFSRLLICVWSFFLGGYCNSEHMEKYVLYMYHCIPPRLDRKKICIDVTLAEHLGPFHGVNGMGKERSSCQTRGVVSCCFQSIVLLGADGWHVCEVQFYLSTAARRRTFFEAVKRGWSRCRPKVWLIRSNLPVQN